MRESIGGAWLFGLIFTFTFIFISYMIVMINYSTVFKIKNEMVHTIEKYEGLSSGDISADGNVTSSIWIINKYLKNSRYEGRGFCDGSDGWYGTDSLDDGNKLVLGQRSAYYCVKPVRDGNVGYYEVKLFLKFELPVIGNLGRMTVNGQTIKIKYLDTEGLAGYH